MKDTVSIIIATLAHSSRKAVIWRAIDSILRQKGVNCLPIVIVNGEKYDSELRLSLERDPRLQSYYVAQGSFPNAIVEGRRHVDTEFYCFLDDDDILLEDSVVSRIRRFREDNSLDVVVGNGYKCDGSNSVLGFGSDAEAIHRLETDPLGNLCQFNWLASCAGLYKADSIDIPYFEDYTKYYEWTYLAFRLALTKRIGFVGEPTYKIFSSSESMSKTDDYIEGQVELVHKLKRLNVSEKSARLLIDRFCRERYHDLSNYYRQQKDSAKAWKYHLYSVSNASGLKFLSYSRHLVMDSLKSVLK